MKRTERGLASTTSGNELQIIVTVNGPGEVASWLHPFATALKQRLPSARLCVAVVPCVFSAGSELAVVKSLPYVDASCSVSQTMDLIWRNRLPEGFRKNVPGFVLHLGGDTIFAVLIARRLRQPCLAYAERPLALGWAFDKVFYSGFEKLPSKDAMADVVGEMMVDAARLRCPDRRPARSGRLAVGLYPGSRDYLAKYMLPFYAAVAERVAETMPEIDWMLGKSDFLSAEFLRAIPPVNDGRPIEGVDLEWREADGRSFLVTPRGLRIEVANAGRTAARANVALTLPGTNTAELSALGVPMIVTVPTWQAEIAPMPGLAGHIGRLPLVGKYIKRGLGHLILRRIRYMSHPNRRSNRMVVPEIVGHITAAQIAEAVVAALAADTRRLEEELRAIMGPAGASQRLVAGLVDFLEAPDLTHDAAPAR